LALQATKPTTSVLFKTGPVNQQNQPVFQNSVRFIGSIQTFQCFEFYTGFQPVLSVSPKTNKTGTVRFSDLCRFFNPCIMPHRILIFFSQDASQENSKELTPSTIEGS
jgi:hypothetical protein